MKKFEYASITDPTDILLKKAGEIGWEAYGTTQHFEKDIRNFTEGRVITRHYFKREVFPVIEKEFD